MVMGGVESRRGGGGGGGGVVEGELWGREGGLEYTVWAFDDICFCSQYTARPGENYCQSGLLRAQFFAYKA